MIQRTHLEDLFDEQALPLLVELLDIEPIVDTAHEELSVRCGRPEHYRVCEAMRALDQRCGIDYLALKDWQGRPTVVGIGARAQDVPRPYPTITTRHVTERGNTWTEMSKLATAVERGFFPLRPTFNAQAYFTGGDLRMLNLATSALLVRAHDAGAYGRMRGQAWFLVFDMYRLAGLADPDLDERVWQWTPHDLWRDLTQIRPRLVGLG